MTCLIILHILSMNILRCVCVWIFYAFRSGLELTFLLCSVVVLMIYNNGWRIGSSLCLLSAHITALLMLVDLVFPAFPALPLVPSFLLPKWLNFDQYTKGWNIFKPFGGYNYLFYGWKWCFWLWFCLIADKWIWNSGFFIFTILGVRFIL